MRAADVGLVASGTATLEAALARCPHVIFYRVTRLTAWIVRRKLSLPWVGLPNVLAGRFVVPEFLQDDATPQNLAQATLNLYDDGATRRRLESVVRRIRGSTRDGHGGARRGGVDDRVACSGSERLKRVILVAGIDEAGRGPLAGPVVAAAVILDPKRPVRGLADSKLLTPERREELAIKIRQRAIAWSTGQADVDEIDTINILHATMLAMCRAVAALPIAPEEALVDGNRCRTWRAACARSSRAIAT